MNDFLLPSFGMKSEKYDFFLKNSLDVCSYLLHHFRLSQSFVLDFYFNFLSLIEILKSI